MAGEIQPTGDNIIAAPAAGAGNISFTDVIPMGQTFAATGFDQGVMPASFGSTFTLTGDSSVKAAQLPSSWVQSNDLPAVPGNVQRIENLTSGDPKTIVQPYDVNSASPPQVLVTDKGVQYAPGFTGHEANITVAYTSEATKEAVQDAVLEIGKLQAAAGKENDLTPGLVDNTKGFLGGDDFRAKFEEATTPATSEIKDAERGSDPNRHNPNGGHNRDTVKPDIDKGSLDDKDEDKSDGGSGERSATRSLDMVSRLRDRVMKDGGMNGSVYRNFLGSILPTAITSFLASMHQPPTEEELRKLNELLKENETEISQNLDKQSKSLDSLGDKDGATALGDFKKQMLADGGISADFGKALGNMFGKSADDVGPSDVNSLLPPNADPTLNVQRAIANLAVLDAANQNGLLKPDGNGGFNIAKPSNPSDQEKMDEAMKMIILSLQSQKGADSLFRR